MRRHHDQKTKRSVKKSIFSFSSSSSPLKAQASYSVPESFFTDGGTPWTSDESVGRPLPKHRTTQTQNKRIHTPNIHALSEIGTHDPSVRVSEDSYALNCAATVTGPRNTRIYIHMDFKQKTSSWEGPVARIHFTHICPLPHCRHLLLPVRAICSPHLNLFEVTSAFAGEYAIRSSWLSSFIPILLFLLLL
jgi:hypothetical protein